MTNSRQGTYLSLRDRLILNFVLIGVVIILVIASFSYYTAKEILLDRTFQQLTSVKVVKKRQIESFFADRKRDIKLIASSQEVIRMIRIGENKDDLQSVSLEEIRTVYKNYLDRYLTAQGYYSSFILAPMNGPRLTIELKENDITDVFNEVAGLNQVTGELADPTRSSDEIFIIDLDEKEIQPGLLIGSPVKENGALIGYVILEVSLEAINNIMIVNDPDEGLGESGESYLVGMDHLMRSSSRFQDNSILKTQVNTEGVSAAINGTAGVDIIKDYRGIEVLSSFSKVDIKGLNWAILAEIDLSEALVPLNAIRKNILLISFFIILALFLAAVILSGRITAPLIRLKNAAERIGQGEFNTIAGAYLGNEIGDLTRSFNIMTERLSDKTEELRAERARRLRSVIDGQELERQRLSRELHDGLGQLLIAIKLRLEKVKSLDHDESMKIVNDVMISCDHTIEEIRRMSNDLMPAVLNEFGIVTGLRNLLDQVCENSLIEGKVIAGGRFQDLNNKSMTYLYRIAQEAVNNTIRHSDASEVSIELSKVDTSLVMVIKDNGTGMDLNRDSVQSGNGLINMKERAILLNGSLDITSKPSSGTIVTVAIPYN